MSPFAEGAANGASPRTPSPLRILAGVLLSLVSTLVPAAGISTHKEVAEQTPALIDASAYPELLDLVRTYPDEFAVGSVFPDWGYIFGDTADAAEATH